MYSVNMAAIDPRREALRNAGVFIVDGIEFIRKDALLEWLEECKNNPVITDLQKGNIQELIDHINEM